ncbi:MAG: transposase family protein, partial [Flavisolibacter sp.]|nr:transposase family protein [Flavisolibacter sp.]
MRSQRQFKRLTGVKRSTFEKMVAIVKQHRRDKRKHATKGSPAKRSIEDKVLMLLMYYREYRTFLHTATTYGYSEAQAQRIIRALEEILIKSREFRLPGKKALLYLREECFIVDVGESPVERPKEAKALLLRQ